MKKLKNPNVKFSSRIQVFVMVLVFGSVFGSGANLAAQSETSLPIPLYFRANLLRWATLTPDLGIEWRINPQWAILENTSYTSWSWDRTNHRYALWEVAPEVRCYLGEKRNWYVGAMYKVGSFNYNISGSGKQGDIMGGGMTGGYMLSLGKRLSIDFGLGLGYIHAKYEHYKVVDKVRVRQGNGNRNWFGPVSAGITFVLNPF